jgi:citrate synthase
MARKRIRIDLEDSEGAKYNFSLEGNVTREKMLKIFELMNLMNIEEPETSAQLDSIGAKIWNVIDKNFPIGKFTSSMILEKYEDQYGEPIKLSVISTYLSRFAVKGKVVREKQGKEWAYQILKMTQREKP